MTSFAVAIEMRVLNDVRVVVNIVCGLPL
jgi:hypothetical protein